MNTKQQEETRRYFRKHAGAWGKKSKLISQNLVNVIRQRNEYVLRIISERKRTNSILDVGCGTGDLVNEIAKRGIRAVGIDFSAEMIRIARDNAKKNNCRLAEFRRSSIFDFDINSNEYDLISANGFIEYISYEQLNSFLEISFRGLKKGGSLVLGSRNRLFNLFSLNDFTKKEIDAGAVNPILLESIALTKGLSISELAKLEPVSLPSVSCKQLKTGIGVSVRYQYSPVQLIRLLKDKRFKPVQISPIHIHGVVIRFKDRHPVIHARVSNLLQAYAQDNRALLPQASSFIIHAKKD